MSEWPFEQDKQDLVFTVAGVLEGDAIVQVHHGLDNFWQFLTADEPDEHGAQLITFEEIFGLDPTLAQLADLKRGYFAERDGLSGEWRRHSEFPEEFAELVAESLVFMADQQSLVDEEIGLDPSSVECLFEDQLAYLTDNDGRRVEGDLAVAGTWVEESKLWVWGWANTGFPSECVDPLLTVQTFGEQAGFERLFQGQWTCEESEALDVAAVAARLLEADVVVTQQTEAGRLYLLLFDLRYADDIDDLPDRS